MTVIRSMTNPSLRLHVGRLIDGTNAEPLDDAAILVVDRTIVEVGPDTQVPTPESARAVELPEATALPGLIDAHVHVTFAGDIDPLGTMTRESDDELVVRGVVNAERLVRAGVTTAFDCGARNMTGMRVREALARRQAVGPRLLVSGRPVTPPRGHCHWLNGEADGAEGARAAVRRLLDEDGADGIKMMATGGGMTTGTDSRFAAWDVEALAAAAEEAHRRGRIITTHAHGVPGIRNATQAGVDAIQHTTMMGPDWTWTFDADVARLMVERGTRACPTMAAGIRVELEGGIHISALQPNPGAMSLAQTIANGRRLREAGVAMIPATDTGVTFTSFSEELFFELELYVAIGFTPLEAIRLATHNAAQYLGLSSVTGQLVPGLAADILVVDGRPDEQITDLRRGRLIVRDGVRIEPTPPPPSPGLPASLVADIDREATA